MKEGRLSRVLSTEFLHGNGKLAALLICYHLLLLVISIAIDLGFLAPAPAGGFQARAPIGALGFPVPAGDLAAGAHRHLATPGTRGVPAARHPPGA